MNRIKGKGAALAAGVVVCAGLAFWASAGDLNPPPGDVTPTMVSLADLDQHLAALEAIEEWQVVSYETTNGGYEEQLRTGSGVIHRVIATKLDAAPASFWLKDTNPPLEGPKLMFGGLPTGSGCSAEWTPDVRYLDGISIYSEEEMAGIHLRVTIYYKPDVP